MMPSGGGGNSRSANPYEHYDNPSIEGDDLIDPDDGKFHGAHIEYHVGQWLIPPAATLDDLDDPINTSTSDRAPLTGNISSQQANSNSRTAHNAQGYLNSAIPGEDRRAPVSTLDETVWETLRRDLLAVWEKMRQVLWPKYLLGGMLNQGGGMGGAERGEGDSLAGGVPTMGQLRGIVGRWPDADAVLQGGMSEGLRDWDLWYVLLDLVLLVEVLREILLTGFNRGPLLFCLLLSFLLSINARDDQRSFVFSGVFAMIWIAEAVVTFQIKLLGGNMYAKLQLRLPNPLPTKANIPPPSSFFQSVCIIGYTLFPLVIAALLSALRVPVIVRIPVYSVLGLWSLAAGVSILGGSGVVKNRVSLAVYPLFVFYIGLDCLCFIS